MAERKFELRGWEHSNPSDPIASSTNVLGMIWDRHCDTLSLNIPDLRELMEEVITKRNILAASHKVFDLLGITGPVLLLPKLWLQSLWKSQIGWDQEVDIKTRQDFLKWLKELEYLKHVQVPRWLHCDSGFQHISLHFFCDASKLAYSAVVFLRVDIGSTVHIQLVQSKTRIEPCGKKETTIARLELLGAAISTRLSTTVLKEFPTDNTVRVEGIRQSSSKWWEGPSWLHLSPQEWPISDVEVDVNEVEVNKERRAIVTSMMNVQTTDIKSDYFSTYSRNNRVVPWILRFIHNVSNATKLKGSLGYEEFKRAEVLVFKSLKSNTFQDERLFAKMQAFKDEDGLLRIRTKLADSYEKEDFKFPILLPVSDVVVKLIQEEHKLREDLRQRFRNEYLALLVPRGTRRNNALEVGDVVLIGHDNVRRIDWPLGVVLEVYPGKDGVPRVARVRTSNGERIRPFQRLYPLEVSAKTEISVLKTSGKANLPVEKTPESSTKYASDSPTDYLPNSPVENTDNSEEKPPTQTRLGRTIKIPRKLDL
ncbi:integrase catalytic domain-containing protein [Trichonephila inaurata madagascariensis]|uniref:Integrase catalytic domain-containing protein n=1 Tax=Trichonephila inaurata madagascariensis TaxID=2747483 RepID=A0A8X6WYC9_9ARAC|nr:integrase catalytic domain-containing protein [Trichonephila inaurata madagascariensis]